MSNLDSPIARLARRVHFSCGHRYFNNDFSEEKNREVFGACYSEHGHGHNYILEAYVEGAIQPDTGMVINMVTLDKILKAVTDPLDHKFLNEDVKAFRKKVPTTENVAAYCFDEIKQHLGQLGTPENSVNLFKVRLYENEDLWVDYSISPEVGL